MGETALLIMHERTWSMSVTAVDVNEGENPIAQTSLELESDLHVTDKLRVLEGRWEKM